MVRYPLLRSAFAVKLTALDREMHFRTAWIAGDGAHIRLQQMPEQRDVVVGCTVGSDAAERGFPAAIEISPGRKATPAPEVAEAKRSVEAAEPCQPLEVNLGLLRIREGVGQHAGVERRDDGAVLGGARIKVKDGRKPAGTRQVLDDHSRLARNMRAEERCERARIDVV